MLNLPDFRKFAMKTLHCKILCVLAALMLTGLNSTYAGQVKALVYTTNNPTPIGQVIFRDTEDGLLVLPTLRKLPPGIHGFHIHEKPNCSNLGMAAGGHFDPQNTNKHAGPIGNGHRGDLPVLMVDDYGNADAALLAPHLNTSMVINRSVVIHKGSDNYSDKPPLGGGGARIACGVIE